MWLTPDEVRDLTGKVKPDAQSRVLRKLGIPHKVRPGRVIVFERDLHPSRSESEAPPAEHMTAWFRENWPRYWLSPAQLDAKAMWATECSPPNIPGVYFLFWQGEVVYVGQSNDIGRRILEHDIVFDRLAWIECDHWRKEVESFYIRLYEPDSNLERPVQRKMWEWADAHA